MTNKPKLIPDGYRNVTPYLIAGDPAGAIDFYQKVFGAVVRMRMNTPDGRVMHAELEIGDSVIMLGGEQPGGCVKGPLTLGGSPVSIYLYVADVDATAAKAVEAGAKMERPVENQFYGDRSGMLVDPFGHVWNIATHVEDVSPEEIERRAAAMFGK